MFERFLVPIYLPAWLHKPLVRAKRAFIPPTSAGVKPSANGIDISGERNVEWSFLSKEMPEGPGEALEFGCEHAYMSLLAAQKGFHVLAMDLEDQPFTWRHPLVEFRKGNFLEMDLQRNHFDMIINCSSVEHVGIAGRYGITETEENGDIEVMKRFAEILKPEGLLLMTVPCGLDVVLAPWNRVYGAERLPRLLAPFRTLKESYWVKNGENQWETSLREAALAFSPIYDRTDAYKCAYALGCFVLQRQRTP